MSDTAIWTEKLVKTYPEVTAVDGLSLNVPRGVVYGFLGRNGAGKSSTVRILLGLARATEGRATVSRALENCPGKRGAENADTHFY